MVSPFRSTNWANDVRTKPWAVRTPGTAATWSVTASGIRPGFDPSPNAEVPCTWRSTSVSVWAKTDSKERFTESVSTYVALTNATPRRMASAVRASRTFRAKSPLIVAFHMRCSLPPPAHHGRARRLPRDIGAFLTLCARKPVRFSVDPAQERVPLRPMNYRRALTVIIRTGAWIVKTLLGRKTVAIAFLAVVAPGLDRMFPRHLGDSSE